jgi:hypothetical protein
MTKSLPLRINWVNTSARKNTLFYESLPVNLVFVLFAWVFLSHLEYFDQLSNCESRSLTWQFFHMSAWSQFFAMWILNFHNDVGLDWKSFSLLHHINEPLEWYKFSWKVLLYRNLINLITFFRLKQLNCKALDQHWYLSSIVSNELCILFWNSRHIEYKWNKAKNSNILTKQAKLILRLFILTHVIYFLLWAQLSFNYSCS